MGNEPLDDPILTPLRGDPKLSLGQRPKLRQPGDLAGGNLSLDKRHTLDRCTALNRRCDRPHQPVAQ